jgi:hypothetical protein
MLHLDVYRLGSFQEVLDLGFEELLDPDAILVVEWGQAVRPLLPARYLDVDMVRAPGAADFERVVTFWPQGVEWIRKLQQMRQSAEALLSAMSDEEVSLPRFMEVDTSRRSDNTGGVREDQG